MRYFYKDPLAAAWMMKHFRVIVQSNEQPELVVAYPDIIHPQANDTWDIKPNSLYYLELQLGDTVRINNSDEIVIKRITTAEERDALRGSKNFKIIMRNDTVFHWPESEK